MAEAPLINDPFVLPRFAGHSLISGTMNLGCRWAEMISGLARCGRLYAGMDQKSAGEDFPSRVLELLNIGYQVRPAELELIPRQGGVVLVANHPFGGVEGLVLMDLLQQIRPDVRFMANTLLQRIPELRERLIAVDPFGGTGAARSNIGPLRRAIDWIRQGGLLVIFPAGEVSALQPVRRTVSDPPWSPTLARIVRRSGAPVVPVYFPGRNSVAFQAAGLLHPRLRTALLPRELLNKRGKTLSLRIGGAITAKRLAECGDDLELTQYLRARTYLLARGTAARSHPDAAHQGSGGRTSMPLAEALPVAELEAEIAKLPADSLLTSSGPHEVFVAEAKNIPLLLLEIGRLRELTFRQVGEGTGRARDLDRFDPHYRHLFIWHREQREIVGAYRLGATDGILPDQGINGLYTATLFDYQPSLLERIAPALEMGRSFVRPEYQKSYAPLLLLWKGIGAFVARHPRYRYLFGPVSISRDYREDSRRLMASALNRHFLLDDLAGLVAPKLPVPLQPLKLKGCRPKQSPQLGRDMDEISELVADLEEDRKGIPVLLRQYLNLGGRLLAFNLDPDFSDVIDGLLLVDLDRTDDRQLQRYMGKEGLTSFRAHHRLAERCA